MSHKSLRQLLHEVDPHLKVVSGGAHSTNRRGASEAEWEHAGGFICSSCGRETFRSRDGLCITCWDKENEYEYRGAPEILGFLPRSIIDEIVQKRGE